jgi:dTDP-4-dehydrorhamnose reductase/mannose-6-phosphate isomerase-like protein (cupin superfamily)
MILLLSGIAGVARGLEHEGFAVQEDSLPDLSSMRAVRAAVDRTRPTAVVVASALDDAERCESDPDRAFRENAENLIHVAAAAMEFAARPVLVSTAEVFGGRGGPWSESDEPSPLSTCARTRLQGEEFLVRAAKDALIVRTGPVVSAAHAEIEPADDEWVSPIAPFDLGRAIAVLIAAGARGVFHAATRDEPVTRAAYTDEIRAALGLPRRLARKGRALSRRAVYAKRPTLDPGKLEMYLKEPLRPWRDALPELRGREKVEESKENTMGHRQDVRRVDKPWGHEIIWAQTDRYVGKVLFIKAGERLSLQYHEKKDETVHVLTGKMVFEVGPKDAAREDLIMKPGDSYRITPFTVHRMIALEDTQILEASTPELDDVVRLEDKYGRAGTSSP